MHDTALTAAAAFFKIYAGKEPRILDIGSSDLNGTIRSVAPADCTYVGIDVSKGRGVDIVVTPGTKFPFDPDSFDLVVSSSCFEHDPMFWVTTLEVMRVLKPGGVLLFQRAGQRSLPSLSKRQLAILPGLGTGSQTLDGLQRS